MQNTQLGGRCMHTKLRVCVCVSGILEVTSTKLRLRYTAYAGIITGFGGLLYCKCFQGDSWELFTSCDT